MFDLEYLPVEKDYDPADYPEEEEEVFPESDFYAGEFDGATGGKIVHPENLEYLKGYMSGVYRVATAKQLCWDEWQCEDYEF